MLRVHSLGLLAGAALGVSGAAYADQPTSTDEVRAVVAEMLADAETRSSLLAGGDAGHDGRFFIAGDGFRLNVGGLFQFRYLVNFREDDNVAGLDTGDDFNSGFQNRRTQAWLEGKINKDWDFRIMAEFTDVEFESDSGAFTLQDAWVRYSFAGGGKLTWGQFRLPLLREELVYESKQLAVDRSAVNSVFTAGRGQGVMFSKQAESWRFAVSASDGLGSANTDFIDDQNPPPLPFRIAGSEADYAVTGRAEFMFSGNWGMFDDFTAAKGQDFGFLLGVAAHWQQSENGPPTAADTDRDTLVYTFDASLEGDSWNAFGAFVGRYDNANTLGADSDFNDFGFILQAGWRFAENTEIFARWDALFLDSDRGLSDDDWHFLTAGFNHYFAGHAAKFTADVSYAFNSTSDLGGAVGAVSGDTGIGFLGDSEDGEFVIRAQFQLVF